MYIITHNIRFNKPSVFGVDEACGLNSWMTNISMAFNVYIHALPWCLWFKCMLTCLSYYDANNSTHCADALSLHIQHSTVTSFYAVWVYALIASALHCYFFLVCNFTMLCAFTCMMRFRVTTQCFLATRPLTEQEETLIAC